MDVVALVPGTEQVLRDDAEARPADGQRIDQHSHGAHGSARPFRPRQSGHRCARDGRPTANSTIDGAARSPPPACPNGANRGCTTRPNALVTPLRIRGQPLQVSRPTSVLPTERSWWRAFLASFRPQGVRATVPAPLRPTKRIVVHDYSGHPGQAQLSRALARRGYEVTHQHCPSYATGKGSLQRQAGDPAELVFESVPMDGMFAATPSSPASVRSWTTAGRLLAASPTRTRRSPSSATCRCSRTRCWPAASPAGASRWSSGTRTSTPRRSAWPPVAGCPVLGDFVARVAERLERTVARRSAAVVAISPTFLERLAQWGVATRRPSSPTGRPSRSCRSARARTSGAAAWASTDIPVVLYSGTLGLKHDPSILALIAAQLRDTHPDAKVVVVSEGKGRDWLEAWKAEQRADNLVLLDYQPYEDLPYMMASADVLVAILEPDASQFRSRPRSSPTCARGGPSSASSPRTTRWPRSSAAHGRAAWSTPRTAARAAAEVAAPARRPGAACQLHGAGRPALRRAHVQPRGGGRSIPRGVRRARRPTAAGRRAARARTGPRVVVADREAS